MPVITVGILEISEEGRSAIQQTRVLDGVIAPSSYATVSFVQFLIGICSGLRILFYHVQSCLGTKLL